MKKLKETEKDKESDAVDGVGRQIADALVSHQKAADKHKFHSVGYQKKKQKLRSVATLGKESPKSRGQIQDLFIERCDKTPMHEEQSSTGRGLSPAEMLKTLQSFAVPDNLNWWSIEGDKAEILEKNWTDMVLSHQFADRFSAYFDYCWEEERNVDFTRRQLEVYPHFSIFVKWVESHPLCGRMRLNDMQAKPHQRITKYPLLLKAIQKATQDPSTQQTLNRMINSVSQFLDSINEYLNFKDDELALFVLSQKIEGYELQGMSEEIEKLEVVVLLFTDVLLLTKTQKKSDKQKVVRPPLSLERILCAELKDGYSFVLMEVSDLGCPVSVYNVSTPSQESCAAWITTIHQAQEALRSLRKMETFEAEEPCDQILEDSDQFPPLSILNINDTGKPSKFQRNFASLRFTAIQLEKEKENLHNQNVYSDFLSTPMQNGDTKFNNEHNITQETKKSERGTNGHCENSHILNNPTIERRVTWNHKVQSQKYSSDFLQQDFLETNESTGPHHLLVGGLRENKLSTSGQFLLADKLEPTESKNDVTQQQSQKPDLRQDSWSHQSSDENESLSESSTFTRILNSPRLRRKRPMNSQPSAAPQRPGEISADALLSNFVSDSNVDHSVRRPSNTSIKSQDHLVLKMSSVKQNRGVFWNVPYERPSESESELPKETHNQNFLKIPKIKNQRSESMHELQSSPLQGLLNRAKERDRERGIAKREGRHNKKTSLQNSNSDCTTITISSPSEAEKDTATELALV
ncbi:Pleckstrin homology domain-containing family G member 6 [Bagarius yarrelli]|uniref:Pleckstrin homology domain-containing family G member 6 n=1 Tax=Bagarius yarrelli TaxID=175774 RepID=A0A556TQ56_BAGYA|nr:Pleckstrin homology domain-containing family G member 6 [Bagarius yarrelli]